MSRQTTPAPLPAVDIRQSHNYGSRGRANLRSQLAAASTNFNQAFATGRTGAGVSPVLEESHRDEEELPQQPPTPRQGTVVESMAHYEGSAQSQGHRRVPTPPAPPAAAPRAATPAETPSPWSLLAPSTWSLSAVLSAVLFAVPRYLWRNLWALLVGALLLVTAAHISLPEKAGARRDEIFRGLKLIAGLPGYDFPPGELEKMWLTVRYNSSLIADGLPAITDPAAQHVINIFHLSRIDAMEANYTFLSGRTTALEEFLPPRMVVDVVDGEMVINEDFWHALDNKLRGSPALFDGFVSTNLNAATDVARDVSVQWLESAVAQRRILDRDGILELLEQNGQGLETRFTAMLRAGTQEAISAARTIAAQVAAEVAENAPADFRTQLALLAKSNLITNTYDALSTVNYFSPNLGAVVDPHGTSPTAQNLQKIPSVSFFGTRKRREHPPIMALIKWDETGDCWCAAESPNKGKAQLAVMTEHKIAPKRLVVEHVPATGTRGIAAAPQDIELWAETFSEEQASIYRQKISDLFTRYDMSSCMDTAKPPPTNTSVCVGVGTYDIHGENWVQSFPMFVDMESIELAASKFYYRVTSNWGADHTCSYRLRLTGEEF